MATDMTENTDNKELEQYGVWVKKAPSDYDTAETVSVQPESSGLTEAQPDITDATEEIDIDSFFDTDMSAPEPAADAPAAATEDIDIGSFLDSTESIDIDSFMPDQSEGAEKKNDIQDEPSIDMDLSFDDTFSKGTEADPVNEVEVDTAETADITETIAQDTGFDNFDDMFDNIKDESEIADADSIPEPEQPAIAPGTIRIDDTSEFDDLLDSLSDDSPADDSAKTAGQKPEETIPEYNISVSLDDEFPADTNQVTEQDDTDIANVSFVTQEEINELDKPQGTVYNTESAVGVATAEELSELDALIDAAVTEDAPQDSTEDIAVQNEPAAEKKTVTPQEKPMDDMTKALLDKIVQEISALRNEFSDLKHDVEHLKQTALSPAAPQEEPAAEQTPETPTGGFFNEDVEDETIALSGDELNNILNNADFTEEFAGDAVSAQKTEEPETAGTESIANEIETDEPDAAEIAGENEDILPEMPADVDMDIIAETEPDGIEDVAFQSEPAADEIAFENPEAAVEAVSAESAADEDETAFDIPDFTESEYDPFAEDAQEAANDSPFDFDEENLKEPELDDLNFSVSPAEDAAPEVIADTESMPAAEDILVEPSTQDFLDSDEQPVFPDSTGESEPVDSVAFDMPETEDDLVTEEPAEDTAVAADDMFETEPDITIPDVEEQESETEESAEEPTETVFTGDQWEPLEPSATETDTVAEPEETAATQQIEPEASADASPDTMKEEIKNVLSYMDQLLENLPEEKIAEFARSEHFDVYKKLFKELGLS